MNDLEFMFNFDSEYDVYSYNNVTDDILELQDVDERIDLIVAELEELRKRKHDLDLIVETKLFCNREFVNEKKTRAYEDSNKKKKRTRKQTPKASLIVDDPIIGEHELYVTHTDMTDEMIIEGMRVIEGELDEL